MRLFLLFVSCLLYLRSFGQVSTNSSYPRIGPIYTVANNNSVLNFTFVYPTNYKFDKLDVRFTVYNFALNDTTTPQAFPFGWVNFTDSNFSLPWVVPPIILPSNDYIIACFRWYQADANDQLVSDTNECVLSRIPSNNTILPTDNHNTTTVAVANNAAIITTYFPRTLPYDQVNVTIMLNNTMSPSMMNSTNNATYSSIQIFTFTQLTPGTYYNACIQYSYTNLGINGSQKMDGQCQWFMTQANGPAGITSTPTMSITSNSPMNTMSSSSMDTMLPSSMDMISTPAVNTMLPSSMNMISIPTMNMTSNSPMNIISTSSMNMSLTSAKNSSKKFLPSMTFLILLIIIALI